MIALRNKLYESLLDDENELVNDDKAINELVFYNECKEMIPGVGEYIIKRDCHYNNGKIKLNVMRVSSDKRTPSEYGNNIFKGFSTSSDINYISCISIDKYYDTKKLDPNKYSISKVNKYPININRLHWFDIYSNQLLDYCPNIKIDEIDNLTFYTDNENPPLTRENFDFFKNVKHISYARFADVGSTFKYHTIIPKGIIRNLNVDILEIHISHIIQGITNKSELTKIYEQTFNDFIDDLYNYNNIGNIYINTHSKITFHQKRYNVIKGKTKLKKYILK